MKGSKLAGVLVASAIVGLSLGDALTGHGIKGNKNLNPIVVGDGSSSSGSGSSSSGNSGSGSGSGSSSSSSSSNSGSSSSPSMDDSKMICVEWLSSSSECVNGKIETISHFLRGCEGKGPIECTPGPYTQTNRTETDCL